MSSSEMRSYIKDFCLYDCPHGNQGYRRVLIQLFGYTGHGKSSFINSCKYAVDNGRYKVYAKVAPAERRPETMIRSSYALTETITLVDNRGCVKLNMDETGEIYAQLGNFLRLDTKVIWDVGYERTLANILDSDREDHSADFLFPLFVYKAENRIYPEDFSELKEIFQKAKEITGIFPMVVLTHETSEHLPEIQEKFRQMGAKNIFTIENYTKRDTVKTRQKHETILKCLCEIIKDVEFRMEDERDPIEERNERKKILHTLLIQREVERVKEAEAMNRLKDEQVERPSMFTWLTSQASQSSCTTM